MNQYSDKKIVVFDLDDTLSQSKTKVDEEMKDLIERLLGVKKMGIISGQGLKQILWQTDQESDDSSGRANLFVLPGNGSSMYTYSNETQEWKAEYEQLLSSDDEAMIGNAYQQAISELGMVQPENLYGAIMENRGGQITFSALGQQAPLDEKKAWDPDQKKRLAIIEKMEPLLPNFLIKTGGTTSVDVTPAGTNKASGAKKLLDFLQFSQSDLLYIGDAIYPGGNDYSMKEAGYDCIKVENPEDTKSALRELLQ